MITVREAELYARLTLKQWNVADVKVTFHDKLDNNDTTMGQYFFGTNEIMINTKCLNHFRLFEYILKHEIAHKLDHKERGTLFTESGRVNFHGKNFRKWCKILGIKTGRFVPSYLVA